MNSIFGTLYDKYLHRIEGDAHNITISINNKELKSLLFIGELYFRDGSKTPIAYNFAGGGELIDFTDEDVKALLKLRIETSLGMLRVNPYYDILNNVLTFKYDKILFASKLDFYKRAGVLK